MGLTAFAAAGLCVGALALVFAFVWVRFSEAGDVFDTTEEMDALARSLGELDDEPTALELELAEYRRKGLIPAYSVNRTDHIVTIGDVAQKLYPGDLDDEAAAHRFFQEYLCNS